MRRSDVLRSFLSGTRWYVVNMLLWLRGHRKTAVGPSVHFDLHTNQWHRYLHIFILFLHLRGYTVHLRHRWRFIGSWASYDLFRRSPLFHLAFRRPKHAQNVWLFTDRPLAQPHVRIDTDYYPLPGGPNDGIRLPMPLVDTLYIQGAYDRFPMDPAVDRQRGVFFFGNMDRRAYSRTELHDVFGCFHRTELLDMVRRHFPERIHEPVDLDGCVVRDGKDIVLSGRQNQYIAPAGLLPILARFDFFLAPSGVVMPLCHNVVEALCAGCIPILQYAHLMTPALEHGVNCLAFRTEEDLVTLLRSLPGMDPRAVQTMRRNALAYYHQHLTPEAVIGSLEREGMALTRLRMNGELISTQVLRAKLDKAGIKGPLPFAPTN